MQALIWKGTLLLLALFVVYLAYKRQDCKTRIKDLRHRSSLIIEPNRIIIAIDPVDVFVSISNTWRSGFTELEIQKSGNSNFVDSLLKKLRYGVIYYKVRDKKQNIEFIKLLLSTKKVELYLYTTLQQSVSDSILKKLGLGEYFKKDHRIFCSQPMKHPTQVDSNTKRVLILTGSKKGYADEDSNYFLVVRRRDLLKYGRALSDLISNNVDIDELHSDFARWKMAEFNDSSHQ